MQPKHLSESLRAKLETLLGTPALLVELTDYLGAPPAVVLSRPDGESYGFAASSSTGRGSALRQAAGMAYSGSLIDIGPSTYDLGSTQLAWPDGATLRGCGSRSTTITRLTGWASGDFAVVQPAGSLNWQGVSIEGYYGVDSQNDNKIGTAMWAKTGAAGGTWRMVDCHIKGSQDGLSATAAAASIDYEFHNCRFTSRWDSVITNRHVYASNCDFTLDSTGSTYSGNIPTGFRINQAGKIVLSGCKFFVDAANGASSIGTTEMACAIKLQATGASVYAHDCYIETTNGAAAVACLSTNSSFAHLSGCVINPNESGARGIYASIGGAGTVYLHGGTIIPTAGSRPIEMGLVSTLSVLNNGCEFDPALMAIDGTATLTKLTLDGPSFYD